MLRPLVAKVMKVGMTVQGRAMKQSLDTKSRNAVSAQNDVLKDILCFAKDTVYGTSHRFGAICTPGDYAEAVPINTYEDLRPLIDRHAAGEEDILFPGKPKFYATTSGTTDKPKLVPITEKYNSECYTGLTQLWFYSLFQQNPDFLDGRDISMVGKTVEGRTPDGTTYGSFSGHMNADMPEIAKRFRVIPFEAHDIDDYTAKYYTLMRIGMEVPIRWIVAANPSTLVELHRFALTHYDAVVRDIEKGTLRDDIPIPQHIRVAVQKRLRPNPKRAEALRRIAREHREILPKHYWPGLRLINTWKCGNSGLYLRQTDGYYPEQTVIREFGYIATEARAGIVLDNDDDASVLAAHLLYFEFIKTSDMETDNPRVYRVDELSLGETYNVIVTTPSGLYRYDMNDIVRVDGFYNQFPKVTFQHKGKGVVSLTGEKLSETQYLAAMDATASARKTKIPFHVAFGDVDTSCYHVFIETDPLHEIPDPIRFAQKLDEELSTRNMEYTAKRSSNRLKPPSVHILPSHAFERYKHRALEEGAREGQFKLTQLSVDDARYRFFRDLSSIPKTSNGKADRT